MKGWDISICLLVKLFSFCSRVMEWPLSATPKSKPADVGTGLAGRGNGYDKGKK